MAERQKTQYEIDMCHGPILSKMLRFSIPLMCSSVLQLLFNAADIVVVGRWAGDNSLAAVGSNTALIGLLTNLFVGLAVIALVMVYTRTYLNIMGADEKCRSTWKVLEASLARTVEIAEKAETRVIVHVTDCSMPLDKLAGMLRPGDVICHIYQNRGENTCLDADGKVLDGLWAARKRGVLFDASNGRGNYDLNTCRAALAQGFVPDVISSDMNYSGSFLQPLHSLPRVLSKYLDFGMSLEQVLDAAVTRPAELIGRPELASMAVGTPADVAIFELRKKPVSYFDVNGNTFDGTQVLVPMMTFKDGECMYCQADFA